MTAKAYIGLGSNLGDSFQFLQNAVDALQQQPEISLTSVSPVYQSKPQGPQDQPDYLNAVVEIATRLSPQTLLQCTQSIEDHNQRQRTGERWGARTLDLDILLYNHTIINQSNLVIPHPWMCKRSFVIYPLYDIAPELILPNGKRLQSCLADCPNDDLTILDRELLWQSEASEA